MVKQNRGLVSNSGLHQYQHYVDVTVDSNVVTFDQSLDLFCIRELNNSSTLQSRSKLVDVPSIIIANKRFYQDHRIYIYCTTRLHFQDA